MKAILLGGTTIALSLIATVASAQVGATLGAGAAVGGTTAGGSLNAGVDARPALSPALNSVGGIAADGTATAAQAGQEVTGDLKRATRKSRRDVASTTDGGVSVGGRASAQARTPGGGN